MDIFCPYPLDDSHIAIQVSPALGGQRPAFLTVSPVDIRLDSKMKKPIESLSRKLWSEISLARIKRRAEALAAVEVNYGETAFTQAALMCRDFLKESGFKSVALTPLACDGQTTFLDCVMPESWDRTGRSFFEVVQESGRRMPICDTDESPFAIDIWSLPTPAEGLNAPVVDWDALDPADPDVVGKVVLIYRPDFIDAYRACCARKAAAILMCDSASPRETFDSYRWCNGLRRIGWYHDRKDPRTVVFNVTPRKAEWIRKHLAKGEQLTGRGIAATKVGPGTIHTVSGVIPGKSKKEIILCAHIYEPFVTDDSAGAAQAIEVASAIRSLAQKGEIPALKQTLRVVIMMELYGFSQWFADEARRRRALHVFSFDSTCHLSMDAGGVRHTKFRRTLDGCASFTDWVIARSLALETKLDVHEEPGSLSDDTFMSAPLLDIPSNWIHNSPKAYHHNSGPLYAEADWPAACTASTALGTAAAILAAFGKDEAAEIAPELAASAADELRRATGAVIADFAAGRIPPFFAKGKIEFLVHAAKARLARFAAFFKFKDEAAAKLDKIAAKAVAKLGTLPFAHESAAMLRAKNIQIEPLLPGLIMSQARVPWEKRVANPGFHDYEIVQAYCDGSGTLADALRACEYVTGRRFQEKEIYAAIDFFSLLAQYGYFKVGPKFKTTPAQLCEVLRGLGVVRGCKVMVHTSYSALGEMKGGPEAVAKALMKLVGPRGLLLMPAFSFFDYGPDGIFDPAKTKSHCGAVPEAFRKLPGVVRSLNPSNSFAAWGTGAEDYVANHHGTVVMGAESPLGKLERDGGLIVQIQCPKTATFMHVVEMTNCVKCFAPFGEEYPVRFPDGRVRKVKTWSWRDGECAAGELDGLWRLMQERGLVRTATFANATILAYSPADFRACYEEILAGPGGCPGCKRRPRKPPYLNGKTQDKRK